MYDKIHYNKKKIIIIKKKKKGLDVNTECATIPLEKRPSKTVVGKAVHITKQLGVLFKI